MPPTRRTTFALPTSDRGRAHGFLRDGLGLPTPGEPAEDGAPEPLRALLGDDTELMLVPADGFSLVTGRPVAAGGATCLISLALESDTEVDALYARAVAAGGTATAPPERMPWGLYRALVADPDGHLWQLSCPSLGGGAR